MYHANERTLVDGVSTIEQRNWVKRIVEQQNVPEFTNEPLNQNR